MPLHKPTPFPKGDLRRYVHVLHAVATLEHATLNNIEAATGYPRPTISAVINRLNGPEGFGLVIKKNGSAYYLDAWGRLFTKEFTLQEI